MEAAWTRYIEWRYPVHVKIRSSAAFEAAGIAAAAATTNVPMDI